MKYNSIHKNQMDYVTACEGWLDIREADETLMPNYYEVELSNDHDENTSIWICIKGMRKPNILEAQKFLTTDSERYGMLVTGVYELPNREYAEDCYDLSNEENWPIFC